MGNEPQYAIVVNQEIASTELLTSLASPVAARPAFTFEFQYEGQPVLTFRGTHMELRYPAPEPLMDMMRKANEYDRLAAAARSLVMATTPFVSALELGHNGLDGEDLHRELREAVVIGEDEWRESNQR